MFVNPQLRFAPKGAVAVPEVAAGYKDPLQISGITDEHDCTGAAPD
jgi:hypothetical protein